MNDPLTSHDVRLREFRWADIPALVEILNRIYPDEPTTVAQEEHWEKSYPADNPRRRYAVETEDGRFIGVGDCMRPYWMQAPGVYTIYALVAPEWQRRGIGRRLLAALEPFGRTQGATRLWSDCREDFAAAIRFLERAGYTQFGVRFESRLDLTTFDETPFASVFERLAADGYVLTTLAAERATREDADRRLYELNHRVALDVPLPGGARIDQTYEIWRQAMLENPATDPAAIFIAKLGDRYVGLTSLELLQDGPAITSMTGVATGHRGRGLALALKLASFRYLRAHGYRETRAHNDTANPPILHLNEKLGYQRLPGWLEWEKKLG
jgi:RimJ/RimL family protein N-acetyltransferase